MYASEMWTLRKEETDRLNAFEIWVWRRILKISWMGRVINVEVL